MKEQNKKPEKISLIQFLFAIIGSIGFVLGTINTAMIFSDRFIPPKVEVLALRPIALYSEEYDPISQGKYPTYGISAIVHIINHGRQVVISGLDLSGKIYMGLDNYTPYTKQAIGAWMI